MDDFKETLFNNDLEYESYLKICPPKGGNKKEIIGVFHKGSNELMDH
jgi:hypothetical protein